ncbi:MAG: DOMON-like domain-containing protein [Pseudomonadota bacterium]
MKTDAIRTMNASRFCTADLVCHHSQSCPPVRRIEANARRPRDGTIELSFALEGDLAALALPSRSQGRWSRGLWEHTCFETFLRPEGGARYLEFNFSPSGEWAAFDFSGYREGGAFGEGLQPPLTTRQTESRLELDATLSPELLAGVGVYTKLRIALCAVIEDAGGALSYWALRHPGETPDFHHPDSFALELAAAQERDSN